MDKQTRKIFEEKAAAIRRNRGNELMEAAKRKYTELSTPEDQVKEFENINFEFERQLNILRVQLMSQFARYDENEKKLYVRDRGSINFRTKNNKFDQAKVF